MVTKHGLRLTVVAGALLLSALAWGVAAPRVEVDGQLISFRANPIQLDSTIMVPVRDLCRALDAEVYWNAPTQTVTATRGTRSVRLTIGEEGAQVDGRAVAADVPAMVYRGETMVPMAFVSRALGAQVRWSEPAQTAYITTDNAPINDQYTGNGQLSGTQTVVVRQGTVIPVRLDNALDAPAGNARKAFSATVSSDRNGDAEFPRGTRFVGTVAGLRRSNTRQVQSRDVTLVEARLPDGTRVAIAGSLVSLNDRRAPGSRDGRPGTPGNPRWGGGQPTDIVVTQGVELGVLLNRDVSYSAPWAYVTARNAYLGNAAPGYDQPSYEDQWSQTQTLTIPRGTVVPVTLDTALSSATSRLGDGFSVTVRSSRDGDAEFPRGTRFVGNVIGLQRASSRQPGILDLSFREAWLPDGSKVTIDGSLVSLDDRTVARSDDGRLRTRAESTSDDRLKMIGIGAGAGLVIGKLLDQNLIVGGLLGAAAGYAYNEYSADDVEPTNVVVKPGTVFGVRMERDVRFSAPAVFSRARTLYFANGAPNDDQPLYDDPWSRKQTFLIPEGTVIPVRLDTALGSSTSRRGDGFSVTVQSSQDGDAEFPRGTRLAGEVADVRRASANQPGVLDLSFREVWLPDGTKLPIEGSLISLDDKTVTRSDDGRLRATVKGTGDDRLKMIGIGAGAGLVIGKLLDQNLIVGGLLGAAAGYLYNEYGKDEVTPTDVVVNQGTEFGVRIDRDLNYEAPSSFVTSRSDYRGSQ